MDTHSQAKYIVVDKSSPNIEIDFLLSKGDYHELYNAHNVIIKIINLEELYDQMMESFFDYQNKINYWSLRHVINSFYDKKHIYEVISSLNRLAFNTLNFGKLFLDKHYHGENSKCFSYELSNNKSIKKKIINNRKELFNNNVNYAIGCKLRGKSQHSLLPVQNYTSIFTNIQKTGKKEMCLKIEIYYSTLLDMGFSKNRINENDKYYLTDILSGYIHAISTMQELNRKYYKESLCKARKVLCEFRVKYGKMADLSDYRCILVKNSQQFPLWSLSVI